ncbi:MAG TPA: SAM-dependent methyltransferase [Cyclobacteriaceae bacterium]
MHNRGKIFLIPTSIAEDTAEKVIPLQIREALINIKHFLVEDVRTARRYLSSLKIYSSIEELSFNVLNKDTKKDVLKTFFEPVTNGFNLGIISESGCPGVADPGALAVNYAHEQELQVIPLVGPSSILLSLMASGLNGQHFAFHGYLPVDGKEASKAIKDLEKESKTKNQTQIFIETPYRNKSVMQNLVSSLNENTLLCRAIDVTGAHENIKTKPVKSWRKVKDELPKLPAIFLFLAN